MHGKVIVIMTVKWARRVSDNPYYLVGCRLHHVILMFYSCKSNYGSQRARSKSAMAEIFNTKPTSLAWLAIMRERGRHPSLVQPFWILKLKL